jgi:hypothetical protein
MRVAVAAWVQLPMVLVELAVVVLERAWLELLTQAVAGVETMRLLAVLVVLALSSCPFQQPNTLAQPQAHQLSQQAVQTQF